MTTIAIAHDDQDIERALHDALGALDLASLVRGRRVAIKPNDTWAIEEDTTGVTQADTLRAVVRALKQHSPRELIASGGAGAAETENVFRIAGLMDVVRDEAIAFVDHNRPPFATVALDHGPAREVVVHRPILDYEVVVSLAQLKLHDTATVTLALKNIAMSFPAADHYGHPRGSGRGRHFFDDMHGFIAAMAKRFPIHLAIIVGHPAMIGTGPLGGLPVETGLVIASRDAVAADVVGARLLGFRVQGVRHLLEAGELGLGETDLDAMRFPLLSLAQAIEIFTERAYGRAMSFEHA